MDFLIDPFVDSEKYFETQLQQYQFFDKYSRFNYEHGRRETWKETVKRTVDYLRWVSYDKLDDSDYNDIYDAILKMEVMPSMRLLATAGKAAQKMPQSIYNCCFCAIDNIMSFVEILNISMNGVGVGFSVEKDYVNQLPDVKEFDRAKMAVFIIPDSTEGWCKAFEVGLNAWFNGEDIVFDYSQIRPAGSVLTTKGGRASGYLPLKKLLDFTRDVVLRNSGMRLSTLDVYDIVCKIGDCVVSGGHRRTAMLCLFDYDDGLMLDAKSSNIINHPHRYNTNNSVVLPDRKLSQKEILGYLMQMDKDSNGEPGIFSRRAARNTIPNRREYKRFGLNPCQPGYATVLTPDGIRTLDDITVGSVIWSGNKWTKVVNKIYTGIKPVYEYFSSGGVFTGTKEHKIIQNGERVEAQNADSFDAKCGDFDNDIEINQHDVMDGLVIGDGSVHKASNNLVYLIVGENDQDYFDSEIKNLFIGHREKLSDHNDCWIVNTSIKASELPYTYEREVPHRFLIGDKNKKAGFLKGLFSANGSHIRTGTSSRVMLKQTSHILIRQVQMMLSSIGIRSYITINKPFVNKFSNGEYEVKQSYDLNITSDRYKFMEIVGFIQKYKRDKLQGNVLNRGFSGTLQFVKFAGHHKVYDITVDCKEHTYWTGGLLVSNCGEIFLRNKQFCNLSSVVCRSNDTLENLAHKVKIATLIGTIQSMVVNFTGLSGDWQQNCEDERLLGVDLNGQLDCKLVRYADTQRYLASIAIQTNLKYAAKLDINSSAGITTVKPSGNSGVLLNVSSGIHPRWSEYYIRNVRVSKTSPLYRVLKESGVKLSPENGQTEEVASSYVVSFPMKSPAGAITRHDITAIEQLNYWKQVKLNWTEHNPSQTVYYNDDEILDVAQWIYKNQNIIGGLSFLPKFDASYPQAPYIEITRNQYDKLLYEFPKIDFSLLQQYEDEDLTESAFEVACSAGQCDLQL